MAQSSLRQEEEALRVHWIDFIVSNLRIILEHNFLLTKQVTVQYESDTLSGTKAALAALPLRRER